jgi:hypothetical protein
MKGKVGSLMNRMVFLTLIVILSVLIFTEWSVFAVIGLVIVACYTVSVLIDNGEAVPVSFGVPLLIVLYAIILWNVGSPYANYLWAYRLLYVFVLLSGFLLMWRKIEEHKTNVAKRIGIVTALLLGKMVIIQFVAIPALWPALNAFINH